MKLNRTQKIGSVIGGIAGLYLGVFAELKLDDLLYYTHEHYEMGPEGLSNSELAALSLVILPLTMTIGTGVGFAISSAATQTKRQYNATMNATYSAIGNFFELPERFLPNPEGTQNESAFNAYKQA